LTPHKIAINRKRVSAAVDVCVMSKL